MSEMHASLGTHRGDAARKAASSGSDVHAALTRQSLGRPLSELEEALADAMEDIYASGFHDMSALAEHLTQRGVRAPRSRETVWTIDLLKTELAAINASLDEAYAAGGRGA
ncbi:MAG TPA: hypothetical protein PK812_11920 [Beijerinckiaceae bacterium]|mgnify:CR=1 FL=1|nr:hypothetical protein [Beijerinckiaceae bacterium]